MPWLNGAGTTWEVARRPIAAGSQFLWRVSIAELDAGGPFSTLPGIDRIFTLATPEPIELLINGTAHTVRFGSPVRFSGDDTVSAHIAAPALAINVMTRSGLATASVEVTEHSPSEPVEDPFSELIMLRVLSLATVVRIDVHDRSR